MKLRLLLFSIVVFFAFAGMTCLILLRFIYLTPPAYDTFVPKKSEWSIQIDALNIAKSEAYNLFFDSKEPLVVESVEKFLKNSLENDKETSNLGISFEQQLMAYGLKFNDENYIGIYLQLTDPNQFRTAIPAQLSKNQSFAVRDNTALVLFSLNKQNHTAVELEKIANTFLGQSVKKNVVMTKELYATFFKMHLKETGIEKEAKSVDVEVKLTENGLDLKGDLVLDPNKFHQPNFDLKPKGLYIATALIPKTITDSVNGFLKQQIPYFSYQLPLIRSIVCDIHGIMIEQSSMGLLPALKMNMILEFEDRIDLDKLMRSFPVDMVTGKNTLKMGSILYQLSLLNDNTLFLGVDKSQVRKARFNQVSRVKGNLKALTAIGGSQMVMAFLDVIPAVSASKSFINSTEKVDFSIVQRSNGSCAMNGTLRFKPTINPQHEFTKMLIGFGALEN